MLGWAKIQRKGISQPIWQFWANAPLPEARCASLYNGGGKLLRNAEEIHANIAHLL